MNAGARAIAVGLSATPLVAVALPSAAYLLSLTALAAIGARRGRRSSAAAERRFAILVPAHDEAAVIGRTLTSLAALEYPSGLVDVWVVADNCADATAAIACNHGAIVRERRDERLIGKGYALDWLLHEIAVTGNTYDAFVVVDADTVLSPGFLREMDAALAAGAEVAQAYYTVLPVHGSRAEALRGAALALVHYLRPLAKEAFAGSCGLKGNGMCFSRAVIDRYGWPTAGLAEDVEFHLRLVADGYRVAFVPEAVARGEMPPTLRAARSQQERWEAGRLATVRRQALPLLARGLRQRSPAMVDAALEQLLPPLSVPVATAVVSGAAGLALHAPLVCGLAAASLLAIAVYVCGGLALAGAGAAEWRALLAAPLYIGWKAALYLRALLPAQRSWQRTARPAASES